MTFGRIAFLVAAESVCLGRSLLCEAGSIRVPWSATGRCALAGRELDDTVFELRASSIWGSLLCDVLC